MPRQIMVERELICASFDAGDGDCVVTFDHALVRHVDFSHQRIRSFHARGSTFEDCTFVGTRLEGGMFGTQQQSTYRRCAFLAATFGDVQVGQARFEACRFDLSVPLRGWASNAGEFVGCRFSGKAGA